MSAGIYAQHGKIIGQSRKTTQSKVSKMVNNIKQDSLAEVEIT
jgi:hypothetical protein